MHGEEALDQVAIVEQVAGEIRHRLDAEASATRSSAVCVRYSERYCQRSLQPIQPACGSAGLNTNRVEGVASSTWPRLLHHRAALLGDGDDQRIVGVRRIFVGGEIGAQQAEAGKMPVPPVLRRVAGIDARHGNFYQYRAAVAPLALDADDRPHSGAARRHAAPRPTPICTMSPETVFPPAQSAGRPSRAWLLRREVDGQTEFLALTFWESLELDPLIRRRRYRHAPSSSRRHAPCLSDFDDFARHYEVAFKA